MLKSLEYLLISLFLMRGSFQSQVVFFHMDEYVVEAIEKVYYRRRLFEMCPPGASTPSILFCMLFKLMMLSEILLRRCG